MDIGAAYRDTRVRLTTLLREAGEDVADTPVPACPEWSVRDVAAHLAGTCADVLAGNIQGVATEEWTAAQVEARHGRALAELLDEWNEAAEQLEPLAGAFPGRAGNQWVADQHTHEHDIRGALGAPGGRDGLGLEVGVHFFVTAGLAASLSSNGLGVVEVLTSEGDRWVVGGGDVPDLGSSFLVDTAEEPSGEPEGDPQATLRASRFELFRALSGRRSRAQIAAYDWSVDPDPYLACFDYGPFTVRADDLVE